jgi:hypothetical protein
VPVFPSRHTREKRFWRPISPKLSGRFFWRHYVRFFTIFFSAKPKLLKFIEDAHPKNMSTLEADEHVRGCKAGTRHLLVCRKRDQGPRLRRHAKVAYSRPKILRTDLAPPRQARVPFCWGARFVITIFLLRPQAGGRSQA